ncbi:MAG TPA: type II secretion system protein [Phycisphaerae bacterium]|nr:type II secretion system protein [Phycisphaerae bacterium]
MSGQPTTRIDPPRPAASGMTLVEQACVLACSGVLVAVILPALARSGWQARRAGCAANLSRAAGGMLLYASDNGGAFPQVHVGPKVWRFDVIGLQAWRAFPHGISNSRNLFHAVRLEYVTPASLICPDTEDRPAPLHVNGKACHDFAVGHGADYVGRFSYSYHLQFSRRSDGVPGYPLTASADPAMALLADRTPFVAYTSGLKCGDGCSADACGVPVGIAAQRANSRNHRQAGQNVARITGAIEWADAPAVGVAGDNIYTVWAGEDRSAGRIDIQSMPAAPTDSFLVP